MSETGTSAFEKTASDGKPDGAEKPRLVRRGLAMQCEPGFDASAHLRDATRNMLEEHPSARGFKWIRNETVPPSVWIPDGESQQLLHGSERFCTEIEKDYYNGTFWTLDDSAGNVV